MQYQVQVLGGDNEDNAEGRGEGVGEGHSKIGQRVRTVMLTYLVVITSGLVSLFMPKVTRLRIFFNFYLMFNCLLFLLYEFILMV